MEKLTRKQEEGVYKLLHHIHDEKVTQHILEVLGKENWTRDILCECDYLTDEQGVSHYLYENDEYIEDIRKGNIICEGIDVEEIKRNLKNHLI